MRRHAWFLGALVLACSSTPDDLNLVVQPTRVRVSPSVFLGNTPCSDSGGMRLYQAKLLDVTEGLGDAFELPSSGLVPCTADVEFEYVEQGHHYIAEIKGFDRDDLEVVSAGSSLIVDDERMPVAPRWRTTCWGTDGVTPESLGLGGASSEHLGGSEGRPSELGVRSFSRTVVTVRGCQPLSDGGLSGGARVSVSIQSALVDLSCGEGQDQISRFRLAESDSGDRVELGGAGGIGGSSGEGPELERDSAACGDVLELQTPADGSQEIFQIEGFNSTGEVLWISVCRAVPRSGVVVSATCDPARAL